MVAVTFWALCFVWVLAGLSITALAVGVSLHKCTDERRPVEKKGPPDLDRMRIECATCGSHHFAAVDSVIDLRDS